MKRGLDASSRTGAGESAGKLRAGDDAEGCHDLCHCHCNNHGYFDMPNTGDKMAGRPRLGNQIRTQVKLPGIAADVWSFDAAADRRLDDV